ncbi:MULTISPECIES: carbohydrate porin [Pseudomonas]|uniref:carbohydrate porin n=1 Tax=Pseudomonas TaxID=286 RepID=UPI00040A3234|nr:MULTISPECIES: carbohydrate porin [Pseudomonas]MDT8923120.1 carbohydrate porin [Pseudomonas taiwanensis]WEZ90691.1 carbohydrate porin [Pseudomonas sp. NyZ480]
MLKSHKGSCLPSILMLLVSSVLTHSAFAGSTEETNDTVGQASKAPAPYSCEYFDQFLSRATAVIRPQSNCESLLGDAGGIRSELADRGIGAQLTWNPMGLYDLKGQNRDPQEYGGQNFTYSQSVALTLTYDLERIGFSKDAQLTFTPQVQTSNYQQGYPRLHNVAILAVNQPFNDGKLELQYGFYPLIRQFYGMILGGNSASAALGPTSVIPVQVGLSLNAPTPSFDVTFRDDSKRWYNHSSISRSMTPEGFLADVQKNPYGLKWHVDGANPLFVNEFGYKVQPGQGSHSHWFRAGLIYNTSHYTYLKTQQPTDSNYGAYVANTIQLTTPSPGTAQGLYLDTKASWAPKDRNAYNGDVQFTLFDIGLFPGRPRDMTSIGFTRSFISKDFRDVMGERGLAPADTITAVSLSHAFRVTKGIYWINGFTYQDNPTLVPKRGDAFLWQTSMYWNF